MGYHDNKKIIEACLKCAALCNHCATSCLEESDIKMMAKCIQLDMECAAILGGLIGILLGIFVSQIVATFGGWPVVITTSSVLLSFLFSSAIGLFFGWYPARKAAALNPIDALRYE